MSSADADAAGSGSDVSPATPCPAGSVIATVSTGAYYSWPGTVFSSTPPTGNGSNHNPKKLEVRVTAGGQPVPDCEVRWVAAEGHGWGFGAARETDADGRLTGYWTAGQPGPSEIAASIVVAGGTGGTGGTGESRAVFSGTVTEHESRTDSVHLYYDVDGSYTEFKVRITAASAPAATYYSALNWKDAYAGIQFDRNDGGELSMSMVIISVWDAGGANAAIVDRGACNEVTGFGGEGTGTSCRLRFPPSAHGAIPGLPDDYMLKVDDTYELHVSMRADGSGSASSMTFTDVTNGLGPIDVGTQTTGTRFTGGGHAIGFVEEWHPHGNCLSAGRAVYYHDVQARVAGDWRPVKSARFHANYDPTNNEICGNYLGAIRDGKFFMSSGGTEFVGPPVVPGDDAFPDTQPTISIP